MKIKLSSMGVTIRLLVSLACLSPVGTLGQDTILNQHNLWVIRNVETLREMVKSDSSKDLIELSSFIPGIIIDLKYATVDNFLKKKLYPGGTNKTYLRLHAARNLREVQLTLKPLNLGLKIYDAYRPYPVTEKMWESIKDERYVADPKKGSGHNRAIAVDLTIVNLETGKELNMGTGFDNFTDTAHHDFKVLPVKVISNRLLLKGLMLQHGFKALETEWWHYSLISTKAYELLGIGFKEMNALKRRM